MTKSTEKQVYEALRKIVNNRQEKSLNWAVDYAMTGLSMNGHGLKIQCLYVLNNISRWRGDEAKEVRQILKNYSK